MTAEYLNTVVTEYYNGSAWVDISAYVVGDIKGYNGLGGWKPDQRVAVLGTLNITLNNKSKLFSPMGGDTVRGLSTLAGFNKGSKIRVRGPYEGRNDVIWTGRIASIDSDDLNWGNEQARLMAVDWMQVPVNYPMAGATIALNQTIDQAMTLILARLSLQPESTSFDTGSFTFPAVFDNVQRKTVALSEFTKLANSELGYIYPKQDGTLRVENFLARQGWRALDQVAIYPDHSFLLKQDGGFLLLQNGGKLVLSEAPTQTDAALAADAEGYNILLAEDGLLNASIISAHPVITDTSLKVIYKLGTPLLIPSGQTSVFSAHYTDPNGLSQVSGTNMQPPVATTDYLANTAADGSGTNQTANVVVTATYYGDVVEYSIVNNSGTAIYMTFLQARGYGIYYGNSIESSIDDAASQVAYGYTPFQFDMRYQKDAYLGNWYGLTVIEEYKNPKSRITKMKFLANLNKNHMMSFLMLAVGALILGTEDRSNISNHYYVTDRSFTIKQGGIINCEYGLKQNDSYLSGGLNPVTVEFAGGAATDAIKYESNPILLNLSKRTMSAWIYIPTAPSSEIYSIAGAWTNKGELMFLDTDGSLAYFQQHSSVAGWWKTAASTVSINNWHLVTVTHDTSSDDKAKPLLYIDGVSKTVTEYITPVGTILDETGNPFFIGNYKSNAVDYARVFKGKIFDVSVYNRILSSGEVTTLYNAGVPDKALVTSGLVFQGPAVCADQGNATTLAGHVLTSTDRLVENILRAVGIPHGSPVIRANP